MPLSTSEHLDQIENNERLFYFQNATETDIIDSIMSLDKEGGINDISCKFLVIGKSYVSYYLKLAERTTHLLDYIGCLS